MSRKFQKGWSLKTKATLFTLCVFLICLWSLFFYAGRILQKDLSKHLGTQQLSTASIVASAISDELKERFAELHESARICAPLMSSPAALQKSLDMQSVLGYLFNGGIIITDSTGTAIASLPKEAGRVGVYYGHDKWVIDALEGRSSISPPLMGKMLKTPVVALIVPVTNSEGEVVGSLGGVIQVAKGNFLDSIASHSYGNSGNFMLVAPRHRLIVTSSDKRRVLEELPPPGVNPVIDRALGQDGGAYTLVNPHGVKVLLATTTVPLADWQVVVSLPTREAFAPIRHIQRRLLLATLFTTFLAGVLTWWMLKRQLSPLENTIDILTDITESGQPSQLLPVVRRDEVGELISSFNRLLEKLLQREVALRESDQTLRIILDTTLDGYLQVHPQGRLLDANATYCRFSGYTREELLGMKISDLSTVRNEQEIAVLHKQIATSGGQIFESQHRRKDGSVWNVEISKACHEHENGPIFAFLRDITERKQLEQAKLTSQKLESLGMLTRGIAHDFNNILMAIEGNAYLASKRIGAEHPAANHIDMIFKASARAGDLVRRIMAFSRPSEVGQTVVNLNDLMDEVFHLLRPTIPASILLQKTTTETTPCVLANEGQIHEVIVNLVTNAAHAIGRQAGSIDFRLEPVTVNEDFAQSFPWIKAGDFVRLTITDSGAGMDEATLERIFDAFFTTKPVGEGTGLGLSIVHGIMKSHRGAITVKSALGEGSSFSLYFPEEGNRQAREESEPEELDQFIPGLRIMYVDDEESLVDLVGQELAGLGGQVSSFFDPTEALAAFRIDPQNFDILITDVLMPQITGLDLAREVRAIRPELPVLLISGYHQDEDSRLANDLGICAILSKPLSARELSRAITRLCAPRVGTNTHCNSAD